MANKTATATEAGFYELISFKIRTHDASPGTGVELNQIVTGWQLSESMSSPNVMGSCNILDAEGVIRKLPIIGEEIITIKYRDFYGELTQKEFFCFGVRNLEPADVTSDNMLTYKLDFTSVENVHASTKEVAKAYRNETISEMVKALYNEFFASSPLFVSKKPIEVEDTIGNHTLIIPSLSPHDAMFFLARRAYGGENSTNNYKFFETKDSYFFCTPEYLHEKYKEQHATKEGLESNHLLFYTNKSMDDSSPDGQLIAQQTVSGLSYGSPSNTIEEVKAGTYKRSILEIDILNRTTNRINYDYRDHIDKNPMKNLKIDHSNAYIDGHMPSIREDYVIKDFNTPGQIERDNRAYPFYAEVLNNGRVFNSHMSKYSINCNLSGRIKLVPGMVIFIMVTRNEVATNPVPDKERDGYYMITDVVNVHSEDTYLQSVMMTKGGLTKDFDRSFDESNTSKILDNILGAL